MIFTLRIFRYAVPQLLFDSVLIGLLSVASCIQIFIEYSMYHKE